MYYTKQKISFLFSIVSIIVSFKKTTVIKRTTVAVERKAKWPLKVGKCM